MRLFLLILSFFIASMLQAKTLYVYTSDVFGIAGKVKIYQEENNIGEIGKNQWLKIDVNGNEYVNLTFKWGLRLNKKLSIDFSKKDVAFVYIHLDPNLWYVKEQSPPNIPQVVIDDYSKQYNEYVLSENMANHPTTEWDESTLKEKFTSESDDIEGIYENSFTTENSPRYKLGVIKDNDNYKLIYLSGGSDNVWSEGDVKGILEKTATPYFYKTKWYMGNKTLNEEVFVTFSTGGFKTLFNNGTENFYVKLFPTANSAGSNGSNEVVGSGTGFAISEKGYIVTNHHVIEGANEITVKGINGDFDISLKAKVIADDKNNDLAILKITDERFSTMNEIPYELNLKVIDVGSSVFALGYPLRSSMGDEVKLTNGIISSKSGFQGDITTYQISVPVQPGNSGGPLYDNNGNVVGIINAKHLGTDNVSYAIKTLYLYNLIQSLDESFDELDNNTIQSKSLPDQVKKVKNYVYIIEIR